MRVLSCVALVLCIGAPMHGQPIPSNVHALHRPFDEILDMYVRDGFVYYNALRLERAKLDRYVASLNGPVATALANGAPEERKAFWINAYNALVLRTVIDSYPIRGRAKEYPSASIRQIPGAFEKAAHRVAGRVVSLDGIEKEILVPLGDARTLLALGRGAYGGGRLRSEAFDGPTLDTLLKSVAEEAVSRGELVRIDIDENVVSMSPLFSWREAAFTESFAEQADPLYKERSPIERAVIALVTPYLSGPETQFLPKNSFTMRFHDFDWRLNDLGTRN